MTIVRRALIAACFIYLYLGLKEEPEVRPHICLWTNGTGGVQPYRTRSHRYYCKLLLKYHRMLQTFVVWPDVTMSKCTRIIFSFFPQNVPFCLLASDALSMKTDRAHFRCHGLMSCSDGGCRWMVANRKFIFLNRRTTAGRTNAVVGGLVEVADRAYCGFRRRYLCQQIVLAATSWNFPTFPICQSGEDKLDVDLFVCNMQSEHRGSIACWRVCSYQSPWQRVDGYHHVFRSTVAVDCLPAILRGIALP